MRVLKENENTISSGLMNIKIYKAEWRITNCKSLQKEISRAKHAATRKGKHRK